MEGFFFVDKQKGGTTFDVIRTLKRGFRDTGLKLPRKYKIGHCGTLDPIATGLVLVAIGSATKLLESLLGADKVYRGVCRFGATSDTYDADGEVAEVAGASLVELSAINKVVQEKFVGEVSQMPPKYSAKKIGGKRAYDLARAGKDVVLKAKTVRIHSVDVVDFNWPDLEFDVACGSGMYVRSLIHDLGAELGVGGYMTALRRLQVGEVKVDDAVKVEKIIENPEKHLHTIEEVFGNHEALELTGPDFAKLSQGQFVLNKKSDHQGEVLAWHGGKVVGVLEQVFDGKFLKFKKKL